MASNITSLNTPYLVLTGVVVIAIAFLFIVLQPIMQDINALQTTIAADSASLKTKKDFLETLDIKVKQLDSQLDVERQLSVVLPASERSQDVIRIINEYANQAGLTTTSVTNNSSQQAAQANAERSRGEGASTSNTVLVTTLDLSVKGSYNQLRTFLGLLEKSPRILDVTGLLIKEVSGQPGQIEAAVSIQLYSQHGTPIPGL